jgi:hypothetical protein
MATEYKEHTGQKAKDVEKSIADFFEALAGKLAQTQAPASAVPLDNPKLLAYSNAWAGIANSNVSKIEGFSLSVKVRSDYDAIAQKASCDWKRRKAQVGGPIYQTSQGEIKLV